MSVINFFNGLFSGLGNVVGFVTTPIGDLTDSDLVRMTFGDLSILSMLGIGLVATLTVLLGIHLFKLIF